ncbi:MAG: MMPL family transporter [Bacteroidetes bacterium]|nr:MMPL family transporter [Bacteroidota bacterium]
MLSIFLSSILLAAAGWQISQLQFTEETSAIMPGIGDMKVVDDVLTASGISDRIILMVQASKERSASHNGLKDELVTAAELLETRLADELNEYITDIHSGVSEIEMLAMFREIIENLPVLLDSTQLAATSNLLSSEQVHSTIREGYKRVISPAGVMWREAFLNDPLNMGVSVFGHLQKMQESTDFELYGNHFIDTEGSTVFLFLESKYSSGETALNYKFLKKLSGLIDDFESELSNKVIVRHYGAIPIASGNARQIKKDINVTVSIALLILSIFFAFYFRDVKAFLIVFIPAVIGAILAVAFLAIFQTNIAVISLGIGAVLLGISVDYSLHILTHLKRHGEPEAMFRDLAGPILMSSLTTAAAFLCLTIIQTKAIRDLGMFASISVLAAAIIALILLPIMFKWKRGRGIRYGGNDPIGRLATIELHQYKGWLTSIFLITFLLLFFIKDTTFTSDMDKLNYMSEQMKESERIVFEATSLDESTIYAITTSELQTGLRNSNARLIDELDKLEVSGAIDNYQTAHPFFLPDDEKIRRLENWRQFWNEDRIQKLEIDIQHISEELKIKPDAFNSFFRLIELKDIDIDGFNTPAINENILDEYLVMKDGKGFMINIVTLPTDGIDSVISRLSELKGVYPINLRNSTTKYVNYLKTDMRKLAWITFLVVLGILLLIFGRLEIALLVIFPIVISWIWTLGITGLFNIELNIVNIIITTFVFGLGVDYSIFMANGILVKYTSGQEIIVDYKRGIILSCLTTVVGLGALIFAKHPALQSISLISIIGILSTVIVTTTLIPFLFRQLLVKRPETGRRPYTMSIFLTTAFAYFYFVFGCALLTLIILVFKLIPFGLSTKKRIYHQLMFLFVNSLVYIMFKIKKDIIKTKALPKKPVIYIANHQSFLDILLVLIIQPKIIVLTNNWVWNSPFFGRVVRYADFYPVSNGVEKSVEHLQKLVNDGYSIMVFPEGTRSSDGKVKRFKKGAFYLSEQLELDIIPVLIHGTGDCIRKNDLLIAGGKMTMKFLERIKANDESWGIGYRARCKSITSHFRSEYAQLKEEVQQPEYFKDILLSNYLYKGLVLPYYIRVKLKLAGYFAQINDIIPIDARILDLGSGYGYLSLLLHLVSNDRKVIGIDHDQEKVDIAAGCYTGWDAVKFICADITSTEIPTSDVIIIYDVLHYLSADSQLELLAKCVKSISDGGQIIIRDGEPADNSKHRWTKMSEWFSTHSGFNKMSNTELTFLSLEKIREFAESANLVFSILEDSQLTSNKLIVLKNQNTVST